MDKDRSLVPYPPIPYRNIFDKRVLIIMGVGRSGTTILGKLIASMAPTYYLYEPTIMKFMRGAESLAVLFEDYYLPVVQGSLVTYGSPHYGGPEEYWATSETIRSERRQALELRPFAIAHVIEENPLFLIKVVNSQYRMEAYSNIFSNCRFFHIIRNGFDVIRSSILNYWYTDGWSELNTDYVYSGMIPQWIEKEFRKSWQLWSVLTRAAYTWCYLSQLIPATIKYEDLCKDPERAVDMLENTFPIKRTDLTKRHISSIEQHLVEKKATKDKLVITTDMIAEPVRSRFVEAMNKMEYEV